MIITSVNWWAVIAATVVNMVLGSLWYSRMLFGTAWMKLSGVDPQKATAGRNRAYFLMLVTAFITAFLLAVFVGTIGAATAMEGALIGFLLWLGFVATTMSASVLFEGRPVALYAINASYHLVAFVFMGWLFAMWPYGP